MVIRSLNDVLDPKEFGGKASGLSRLIAYNANVPKGFAISKTALVNYHLTSNFSDVDYIELNLNLKQLTTSLLIVRSSGIGEDSDKFSFAGQLDSFVVKNDMGAVVGAIQKCWKGLKNERLMVYCEQTGQKLDEMGVIVQEFIDPTFAGVTFTRSLYNRDEIYTEYVKGRGDQLVSGEVTPFSFVAKIDNQEMQKLPFDGRELVGQCLMLKENYGYELDIEWVCTDDKFYMVQARPITVKTQEKVYWTNTNLNENYPNPMSPLLYSIARDSYYHYFKNLAKLLQLDRDNIRQLEYDFSNTVGIWGNRIYYNMTSIHNIMSASPLKTYFIAAFNKFVGYQDKDVAGEDRSKTTSLMKLIWRLILLNIGLMRKVRKIESMVSSFSRDVIDEKEPKKLFYEFLDLRFHQWYRASLADFFSMIHYKMLANFTRRFYKSEQASVHNRMLQAIPGLLSVEPLKDLYSISQLIRQTENGVLSFEQLSALELLVEIKQNPKWQKVSMAIENYLLEWGFRCSGELMFFETNYVDEPWRLIELLKSYLSQDASDPAIVIQEKAKERKQTMRAFSMRIIKKRHILFPLWMAEIAWLYFSAHLCKQAISARERVRYKQAEMYFRFKQVVKRIGGEDFFYLTYKEIGEYISSSQMFSADLSSIIEQRKVAFVKSSNIFPEHFETKFGQRPKHVAASHISDPDATEFKGLAASGGRVQGHVKVLKSVLECGSLKEGDILVTKQTDPGWAMAFPLLKGLIVEKGGVLSHGAIVAREFGIPAIVGVPGITKNLKDGDEVIIDGETGKIYLL